VSRIVVFDFDGTLSYKDSMKELFYKEMKRGKVVYVLYYFILKLLAKLQITTVRFEKEQMLKILFHSDEQYFVEACVRLAKNFRLNPVFRKVQEHIDKGDRVIILSASSVYFLDIIFAGMNIEIIGTVLQISYGRINGIIQHPFHYEKLDCLKRIGINHVDELYYDSKWDECLIPICEKWHKIQNGNIIK